MKKTISCVIVAAMLTLILCGCGSFSASGNSTGMGNGTGMNGAESTPAVSPMFTPDVKDGIVDDQDGIIEDETGIKNNDTNSLRPNL